MAIVLPVLVKTPHAVTFCFVRVFWIEETRVPAAPVIIVARIDAEMASLGWYAASSDAMIELSERSIELYDMTTQAMYCRVGDWANFEESALDSPSASKGLKASRDVVVELLLPERSLVRETSKYIY